MRIPKDTKRFRRDYKKLKSSNKDLEKLHAIINRLIDGEQLPQINKDHPLKGNYKGYRDCHIENDWLLIYKIENIDDKEFIIFHATGTHSELFG